MEDLFSKIQEILGSEEGREQLKSVAQMLGGDGSMPDLSSFNGIEEQETNGKKQMQHNLESGDLPQIDMNMLIQVQKMLGNLNQEDDNTKLLKALRPHFSEPRQKKVDQAIKMLHLLSVLPMLKESGLLGGLFGDGGK